jgi:hypothetical protein
MGPRGRAIVLVICLLALVASATAVAGPSSPRPLSVAVPGTSPLSRAQVAHEYVGLVRPTNRLARAGSAFHELAWGSRDPVLIAQDMRMWVAVRKAFLRNLRRADFFPADLRARVERVINTTEWQISVYGAGIASLESGRELSADAQDGMRAADDDEDAAVRLLRADLGLPSPPPLVGGSTGIDVDQPSALAEVLATLVVWALLGLAGLGLLHVGLRRRVRVRRP